ncbi:MAG: hypothetical protein U1F70_08105 [Candidatus Competibacteraceae bacterium]
MSNVSLWYTPGERPVAIRWVLIVDPTGAMEPMAVFSTELDRPATTIIAQFVRRWNVEVTFEETRRHWGVGPSGSGPTGRSPGPPQRYSPCFRWSA